MTEDIVQLGPWSYVVLTSMALVSAGIVQFYARSHGAKVIWAQIRMTFQLVLMGFVLVAIFAHPHPVISLLVVAVMEAFALLTVWNQHKQTVRHQALKYAGIGLVAGSLVACGLFILGVVRINPLVNPRYLLPLLGMIVGNSMTAINLAVRYMHKQVESHRNMVETALLLGATKDFAVRPIAREAFISALTPTLTTMFSLGIVMLPGMMTGQILSGSVPLTAVAYQLAIMVAILFTVILSTLFALRVGGKHYLSQIPD